MRRLPLTTAAGDSYMTVDQHSQLRQAGLDFTGECVWVALFCRENPCFVSFFPLTLQKKEIRDFLLRFHRISTPVPS